MSVPGSNILRAAQSLIRPTTIQYYRFVSRSTNSIGIDIPVYDTPTDIKANVQAVKRGSYARMGLDYNEKYIKIWGTQDVTDLLRGRTGDQIEYNGDRYELMNEADWNPIDGWDSALAIQISEQT